VTDRTDHGGATLQCGADAQATGAAKGACGVATACPAAQADRPHDAALHPGGQTCLGRRRRRHGRPCPGAAPGDRGLHPGPGWPRAGGPDAANGGGTVRCRRAAPRGGRGRRARRGHRGQHGGAGRFPCGQSSDRGHGHSRLRPGGRRAASLPGLGLPVPPRGAPADPGGRPAGRPAGADEPGLRHRQDRRPGPVPSVPGAARLRLHRRHSEQPLWARRHLRPAHQPRSGSAVAPLP
jgi:hypothetical protein